MWATWLVTVPSVRKSSFLFSRETGQTKIDLGRHGNSPGDLEIATDRLYRANGRGAPIGRDEATFTSFTGDVSDVSGTFTLSNGTIVVGGSVRFGAPIVVAVLGGTGAYAGARGTLELRSQGEHAAHLASSSSLRRAARPRRHKTHRPSWRRKGTPARELTATGGQPRPS
jgi:hypothetical protein